MASSKAPASAALLLTLTLTLLFVSLATSASCPPATSKTHKKPSCPINALQLGACADILGLVHIVAGSFRSSRCCRLLSGLADLEEATCLCAALKANVLGVNLDVKASIAWVVNSCGKKIPSGFQCV